MKMGVYLVLFNISDVIVDMQDFFYNVKSLYETFACMEINVYSNSDYKVN